MIIHGDSAEVLKTMDDSIIDMVLTDPPYGIGFMNKKWDKIETYTNFNSIFVPIFTEAYRVLKPGGFCLVMASPRKFHYMAMAVEQCGFVLVDTIPWIQGQGFPKGTDLSKQLDTRTIQKWLDGYDIPSVLIKWRWLKHLLYPLLKRYYNEVKRGEHLTPAQVRKVISAAVNGEWELSPNYRNQPQCLKRDDNPDKSEGASLIADLEKRFGEMPKRVKVGEKRSACGKEPFGSIDENDKHISITAPITEQSKAYEGVKYGIQSLKPAMEIILVFQKKPETNPVDNILEWGVGGLNIDLGRIDYKNDKDKIDGQSARKSFRKGNNQVQVKGDRSERGHLTGRYPANIITDSAAGAELDKMSGELKSGFMKAGVAGHSHWGDNSFDNVETYGDSGGASRFFQTCDYDIPDYLPFVYCSKPSNREKGCGIKMESELLCEVWKHRESIECSALPIKYKKATKNEPAKFILSPNHPTVKPVNLFAYLIRLFKGTSDDPIILDPFAGYGTAGVAALAEDCSFILIDKEEEYIQQMNVRIKFWKEKSKELRKIIKKLGE